MSRLAAMLGRASAVLSLVLGRGGSTSRTIRSISRIAPRLNCLRVDRRRAGQQLVEDHARARTRRSGCRCPSTTGRPAPGDMYAGVPTIAPVSAKLMVGQLQLGRLGHAEVDDLRRRPAVDLGDQHVARLEVAVDDPLLVGVLHRLADRDEQLQPGLHRQPLAGRSTR